jgi:hypothetical protein
MEDDTERGCGDPERTLRAGAGTGREQHPVPAWQPKLSNPKDLGAKVPTSTFRGMSVMVGHGLSLAVIDKHQPIV